MPRRPLHRLAPLVLLPLAVACASTVPTQVVEVPAPLAPAANESLAMIVAAKGVQIYECRPAAGGRAEWAFVAPEAELYDTKGMKVGRHYAGPHWESIDGSKIAGSVKARADAPQADAIPWLLLASKSVGPRGRFGSVTSIQRVNTVGGIAPQDGCAPGTVGALRRVGYTADYYFFAAR